MFANFEVTPSFLFTVLLAWNKLQPSKTQVDCSNYPCYNGGTCMPGPADMCICPPGTVQPFCTTSCLILPCVRGTCVGEVCTCPTNFAGPTCDSAIAAYLSPREITVIEGHVGQKEVTVQVCRQPSSVEVTLAVYTLAESAVEGSDFVGIPVSQPQHVTIPAGETCTFVIVSIIPDLTPETINKSFRLIMFDPQPSSSMIHLVSGHSQTTITITDDDPDTEPPTIHNCPDDITVTAPAGAAATTVSWTPPTATDSSGAVTVTLTSPQNPGDSFTIGSRFVTYTAIDGVNNMAFCRFLVTVVDNTPPMISDCPLSSVVGAVSQDGDLVAISWTEPTATDDISGPVTVMSNRRPGQSFSIGSTTVTYTFMDAAGNSALCSFQVSVIKIILQCPGTIMVSAGNPVSFINPTCLQTNNMPVSSSSCVTAGGSTISSDTQVTCSCDNFPNVQCSFEVFVTGLPITIQCPNPMMVAFGSTLQYTTPSCNRNGNLGSSVTCSPSSGLTLTDDIDVTCTCNSYQAYSCSFHVTVTGAPATIQCPDDMTVQFDSQLTYSNPPCISNLVGSPLSLSSCSPVVGSTIMSDVEVTCTCDTYQNVQCSFMVTVEAYVDCPEFMLLYAGDRLSFINPSCIFMGISSPSTCDPQSGFRVLSQSQQVTCTCDNYPDTQCTFQIITQMDCSKKTCNENCYCEETPSCTNQPSVCSSECRIFGCPVNITSESLSQVNPQSSVEIKCILDGSTAVVDRLNIRLSRSEEGLDGVGINRVNAPDLPSNRKEFTYRVMNVSQDDQFFCILFSANYPIGAVSVTEFVYRLPSISDSPTEINRTTTSVTITWRPWNEDTDVGDPPVVAYIPYYKMDPAQDWMSGSRIQDDQTLDYTASSLESDRNYTFSVAAVREEDGGEGPRGPALTIKTLCIDVVPQMVTTTLTATNDVTVTWQQPTVQCSTGITLFTIYYEIEGDVSSRKAAGTADSNVETFTVDGSLLEPGTTYNIAVTVTTDQESAMSEGSTVTTTNSTSNLDRMNNNPAGEPPPSSPVYLVALVIPVLLIIILLVVIIKRIRRKPASEPKPVDVQDVDYVNAGVTDDPEDYIALEEQSRNTPAPKYQDLTEKEASTQVSGYERTILEATDAAPKAMPRQGIKRQTDYQYEDVNLGETDARKLPSVPQPDLQSEDDTEYEVPDMFEEYTGVHINTLGASKPITPRPMKITEYKTFMGRERSKVISEIVQQYMAHQTGQQHPWTAAVKIQNKSKNFFKALLP